MPQAGMEIDQRHRPRCHRRQHPDPSVAADVNRLKLDPRPASNERLRNRSDPAHAGCYKRKWKSTSATGQGAIADNTLDPSVAADVNRLKLDPRPASNEQLRNRSDPAHAGCYKREWKSTSATGQGAIADNTPIHL